jgi:pseudouridylate synthase / pseudouridine kinase
MANIVKRSSADTTVDVLVAGSLAIDSSCDYNPIDTDKTLPTLETSNPAIITQSLGGVGHNIATAAHYAGAKVRLCSIVANDIVGKAAIEDLQSRGLDIGGIQVLSNGKSTAQYVAMNSKGKDLVMAMADFRIFEDDEDKFEELWKPLIEIAKPKWLVVDSNWTQSIIKKWIEAGRVSGARIALEPVSVEKSQRLFYKTWRDRLDNLIHTTSIAGTSDWFPNQLADLITPNTSELEAMVEHQQIEDGWTSLIASLDQASLQQSIDKSQNALQGIRSELVVKALRLLSQFPCILTKLGPDGVLLTEILREGDHRLNNSQEAEYILFRQKPSNLSNDSSIIFPSFDPQSSISRIAGVYIRHFPATVVPPEEIVSVNGVGDTFLGVLVAAVASDKGKAVSDVVDIAQKGSLLTLKDVASVSPKVRGIMN